MNKLFIFALAILLTGCGSTGLNNLDLNKFLQSPMTVEVQKFSTESGDEIRLVRGLERDYLEFGQRSTGAVVQFWLKTRTNKIISTNELIDHTMVVQLETGRPCPGSHGLFTYNFKNNAGYQNTFAICDPLVISQKLQGVTSTSSSKEGYHMVVPENQNGVILLQSNKNQKRLIMASSVLVPDSNGFNTASKDTTVKQHDLINGDVMQGKSTANTVKVIDTPSTASKAKNKKPVIINITK